MRELRFNFRGIVYRVNEQGCIATPATEGFSETWVFLGGSRHHWSRSIDVPLEQAFDVPARLNGCLGWDKDHSTVRHWGGSFNGRLPRITGAHILETTDIRS